MNIAVAIAVIIFVTAARPLFGQATFSGITEPAADAALSFPVSGVLASLPFREGEFVSAGTVIATLAHRTEALEVTRRELILNNARMDLERTEQLFKKTGSVSKEELDEKIATVKVAETELAIAQEDVTRRQLMAPFDGIIADLYGRGPGEGVELLTSVVRIVDAGTCLFVCNVQPVAAANVNPEAKVTIQVGEVTVEGFVSFISPIIEPSSGLLTLKAQFENADRRIVPGAAGQLRFLE